MSSPVKIPLASFISLDKSLKTPVYLQLAQQLINAIQRGYLPANAKLPGSRSLAELFKLHRKTAIAAYEELATQGWIEILPNKGTVVLPSATHKREIKPYPNLVALAGYPKKTGYTFETSNLLDTVAAHSDCPMQFNDGEPDYRLTQLSYLSGLYSAAMKRKTTASHLAKPNQHRGDFLKEQLSNYLNLSRGLHIGKTNLLIARSSEISLYIIAQTLLKVGDKVAVAELGFYTANMTFQKAGAQLITIPVDDKGIDVDALAQKLKTTTLRMVYITPHHHYPTTVNLSAQRRVQLLQLAQQYGFVIIEDDFDYEFNYDKQTALPLASADVNGMVIYLGTFGKSLAPAFSCGFIVAPQNLITELEKYKLLLDRQGDVIMEQILGEMIAEGEMHRHLKKAVKAYHARRDLCCLLVEKHLGNVVSFKKPKGGLAIWIEWKKPISLFQLARECKRNGLFIPANNLYQNRNTTAMRLGFGHLNDNELHSAIETLATSLLAVQTT